MMAAAIPNVSVELALAATTAMAFGGATTAGWTIRLPNWLPWAVLATMGVVSCWFAISHPDSMIEASAYQQF
jgi:hypothetical protein